MRKGVLENQNQKNRRLRYEQNVNQHSHTRDGREETAYRRKMRMVFNKRKQVRSCICR